MIRTGITPAFEKLMGPEKAAPFKTINVLVQHDHRAGVDRIRYLNEWKETIVYQISPHKAIFIEDVGKERVSQHWRLSKSGEKLFPVTTYRGGKLSNNDALGKRNMSNDPRRQTWGVINVHDEVNNVDLARLLDDRGDLVEVVGPATESKEPRRPGMGDDPYRRLWRRKWPGRFLRSDGFPAENYRQFADRRPRIRSFRPDAADPYHEGRTLSPRGRLRGASPRKERQRHDQRHRQRSAATYGPGQRL